MIDFTLNGHACRLPSPAPGTSVLEVLRTSLGQGGTKEGCASGDCGACTIALQGPGQSLSTANACLMPAHQLAGCDLITVEGLADTSQAPSLSAVQQALVSTHASQCGFCTPGIAMSLAVLHARHQRQVDKGQVIDARQRDTMIDHALGGNLCRCTGYRPIREAAHRLLQGEFGSACLQDAGVSTAKAHDTAPDDERDTRRFYRPVTLQALLALRAERPDAALIAGGTDLMLEHTQRLRDFPALIDTTQVAALGKIEEGEHAGQAGWWIGAAVSYHQLMPLLREHYPDGAELLTRLGSEQIRHRGTLGGNIGNASPIGDMPPLLIALDAYLQLMSQDNERILKLEDYFLDYKRTQLMPDEIIHSVFLPRPLPNQRLAVHKLSKRRDDDISTLLGVFAWRRDASGRAQHWRVAFGGMAGIPARAPHLEALLTRHSLESLAPGALAAGTRQQIEQAVEADFSPLSDVRGSREYRLLAASHLIPRVAQRILNERQATTSHTALESLDAYLAQS
ncbi:MULTISPECIES: xanthine dehydrogenase small subunit [unclassified Cobetia]|uniref:xanthine dehydrogenase small subunit n=1 Tax=unclassified Cobetia TaxID=2609414 RepID=UPI0020976CDA|nr:MULTISPECIES: FAD binding domain-containing protein [unclassified Cobetia]MCO7233743.1 FAD binding domain-containing protein [Cobetia sp. Dlab-2-AX]MCO7237084.1 FAD binding domain-containing protein [Cobetia sp. Dlab-2-U]